MVGSLYKKPFYYYFFPRWPSRKVLEYKIPGIKKLPNKIGKSNTHNLKNLPFCHTHIYSHTHTFTTELSYKLLGLTR